MGGVSVLKQACSVGSVSKESMIGSVCSNQVPVSASSATVIVSCDYIGNISIRATDVTEGLGGVELTSRMKQPELQHILTTSLCFSAEWSRATQNPDWRAS